MNTRTRVVGLASMGFAAWVGACATQPAPACPIATGAPQGDPSVQPNFWAGYTLKSGSGSCAGLGGEEVGVQRFETPGSTDLSLAMRSFRMGFRKGNLGWPVAYDTIDDKPVVRSDPADPEGKKMSAIGKLSAFPSAEDLCTVTQVSAAEQTWREETFRVTAQAEVSTVDNGGSAVVFLDGGARMAVFPETHFKYEWSNVQFISSAEVPGQVFTADLTVTEDSCTATYSVQGLWPMTLCQTDLDCSPYPLPDATDDQISINGRRFQGSGLNPALQNEEHPFHCNRSKPVLDYTAVYGVGDAWGVCEMARPLTDFTPGN